VIEGPEPPRQQWKEQVKSAPEQKQSCIHASRGRGVFLKEDRKILAEERVNTHVGGKVIGGVQRILAGPKGAFRQEIVYLGRSVGDPILYPPGEKERMLAEAKRLLFELAGQSPSQ
jgi:hypothetical protein